MNETRTKTIIANVLQQCEDDGNMAGKDVAQIMRFISVYWVQK